MSNISSCLCCLVMFQWVIFTISKSLRFKVTGPTLLKDDVTELNCGDCRSALHLLPQFGWVLPSALCCLVLDQKNTTVLKIRLSAGRLCLKLYIKKSILTLWLWACDLTFLKLQSLHQQTLCHLTLWMCFFKKHKNEILTQHKQVSDVFNLNIMYCVERILVLLPKASSPVPAKDFTVRWASLHTLCPEPCPGPPAGLRVWHFLHSSDYFVRLSWKMGVVWALVCLTCFLIRIKCRDQQQLYHHLRHLI